MSIAAECGRRLRDERLLHGLTITEVALSVGMHPHALQNIEKGRNIHGPRIDTIARVLSGLPNADLERFMLRLIQVAEDEEHG